MTRWRALLWTVLSLALSGCASSSTSPAAVQKTGPDAAVSEAAILPGDNISVHISGITPNIDQQEVVNEFGTITLPYIKEIKAQGCTPGVLAKNIERAYIDGGYYTKLSVSISLGPRDLYIRGEVRVPGRLPWSPGLTVVQAISLAGGFTDYANRSDIEVRRKDRMFTVNFKEAEKDPSKDSEVFPRDDIKVGHTFF